MDNTYISSQAVYDIAEKILFNISSIAPALLTSIMVIFILLIVIIRILMHLVRRF